MEQRKCKNCQRILPEGYKHKYCEHCRGERAMRFKDGCKKAFGVAVLLGGALVTVITSEKIAPKKK